MPWFDKSDARVPDEIRDARPEELIEAVKFYKENKDKVPQISSELETTKQSLASIEAQHNETKNKLASLEQGIQEAQRQRHTSPKDPEAPVDFFDDPDKAFNQRQGPRDMLILNTRAQVAQMGFEGGLLNEPGRFGDDPKVYKKYQKEVVDLMQKEPLVNQGNPQVWKNAFLLVKGLHADEIHEARKSNDTGGFFGETPKPAPSPEAQQKDEVTDDDRAAAKRYGVTPEEVLASRKAIKIMPVEA